MCLLYLPEAKGQNIFFYCKNLYLKEIKQHKCITQGHISHKYGAEQINHITDEEFYLFQLILQTDLISKGIK